MKTIKIIMILFLMLFASSFLVSQSNKVVGKVTFLLGSVKYNVEGNKKWNDLQMGMNINYDWILKGSDDSDVEITWNNGEVVEITGSDVKKIADLLKSADIHTGWFDKMKKKVDVMFSKSGTDKVQGVAGVRRSKVTIQKKDSLYWAIPKLPNFKIGYSDFQNGKYDDAIKIFEDVVQKEPLSEKGEIARSCLVLAYSKQNNPQMADKHIQAILRDFPNSDFAKLLKKRKIK